MDKYYIYVFVLLLRLLSVGAFARSQPLTHKVVSGSPDISVPILFEPRLVRFRPCLSMADSESAETDGVSCLLRRLRRALTTPVVSRGEYLLSCSSQWLKVYLN